MKWIIQDNLYKEKAVGKLIDYLNKIGEEVITVKVIPFTDGQLEPDPDIEDFEEAIVIGSGTLNKYAKRKWLNPGTWSNSNFNYQTCLFFYGSKMLNHDATFTTLAEAKHYMLPDQEYFLRPNDDGKSFAGEILKGEEAIEWFNRVMMYDGTDLTDDTIVMVCPLVKIYEETRCIAIDGEIVTASIYKQGREVIYLEQHDQDVLDFAQKCIDIWSPAKAFTIDIARTDDGLKIIEINNMNSAGWYACDVQKIVNAILK